MNISYKIGLIPDVNEIVDVYNRSGINRPTTDVQRIEKMYANSNLVVSAWDADVLVGISRSLTDFCYCCYLSDLAVITSYQKRGIGKKIIETILAQITEQTTLILLAAPSAIDYYPKVGMQKINNGFIINRRS